LINWVVPSLAVWKVASSVHTFAGPGPPAPPLGDPFSMRGRRQPPACSLRGVRTRFAKMLGAALLTISASVTTISRTTPHPVTTPWLAMPPPSPGRGHTYGNRAFDVRRHNVHVCPQAREAAGQELVVDCENRGAPSYQRTNHFGTHSLCVYSVAGHKHGPAEGELARK
jgi:hypothetical protein